jgi:hypothetical protein
MEALLGNGLGVFFGVTVCLMGFAAFMTGRAMALTWKPGWHAAGYACLLGLADRFLSYALFGGELLLASAYLIDTAVLAAIALLSYRKARARKMVEQYPWLYERAGLLDWREKSR